MTSFATPICVGCKALRGDLVYPKCAAYPEGIPREIQLSDVDHRQPHANDHGIRFTPKSAADAEYADALLGPMPGDHQRLQRRSTLAEIA